MGGRCDLLDYPIDIAYYVGVVLVAALHSEVAHEYLLQRIEHQLVAHRQNEAAFLLDETLVLGVEVFRRFVLLLSPVRHQIWVLLPIDLRHQLLYLPVENFLF